MKTIITKTFDGKVARNIFQLENNKTLEITTMKRPNGKVISYGSIWKKINKNTLELEHNFNGKFIDHGKILRLTEKKLLELHESALIQKDIIFSLEIFKRF